MSCACQQSLFYSVVDVTALTPCTRTVGGKSAVSSVSSCRYVGYTAASSPSGGTGR